MAFNIIDIIKEKRSRKVGIVNGDGNKGRDEGGIGLGKYSYEVFDTDTCNFG